MQGCFPADLYGNLLISSQLYDDKYWKERRTCMIILCSGSEKTLWFLEMPRKDLCCNSNCLLLGLIPDETGMKKIV